MFKRDSLPDRQRLVSCPAEAVEICFAFLNKNKKLNTMTNYKIDTRFLRR